MVLFWNMAQVDQYLESKKSKELSKKIYWDQLIVWDKVWKL